MSDEAIPNHVFVLPPKIELSADQFKCLLDAIGSLKSEIDALKIKISDQDKNIELRALEIAQDRKRISKLEHPHEPKDPAILDDLYKEMIALGRKQVDFATAARMVKKSKSRMLQIKAMIGQDMRFVLVPSESHSQKVLIRIR